jgi:ketosteroid isomerase-like protein
MPVETYLAALNEGAWDPLALRWKDEAGLARLQEAVASWRDYEERPLQVVEAGGAVALRTHFGGTTADGIRVELEPLTVLVLDGDHIAAVSTWHAPGAAPEHRELPAVAVIGEYFRASNDEDWQAFELVWADDAELHAVGGPPRHGRAEVARAYRLFLGLFGSHRDELRRLLVNGRTVTATGRFFGTNAQGVAIEFDWADVIELTEDERRIQRLWHWHDRDLARRLMSAAEPQ